MYIHCSSLLQHYFVIYSVTSI